MDPFNVERMGGAYENTRNGDSEPVSIKLMELHALGNPHPRMESLIDELVDIMKKQLAMDLNKDWVVPLYMGNERNYPNMYLMLFYVFLNLLLYAIG